MTFCAPSHHHLFSCVCPSQQLDSQGIFQKASCAFRLLTQAQLSFGQYLAPIFFVLAIIEANGVLSMPYLYTLGGIITAARLSHVMNLSFPDVLPQQFRMFGFLGTVAFFILGGALVLLIGLQVGHPTHPDAWQCL